MAKRNDSPKFNAFIGLDPGNNGGIAVIYRDSVETFSIPESEFDLWRVIEEWCWRPEDCRFKPFALLEKVSSSPQMGVTSAFTFGQGYGRLSAMLTAAGTPFDLVTPQKWQAGLAIPKMDKETETQNQFKDRLLMKAKRLFPKLPLWKEKKALGRQRAVADALLIAQYCQLTMKNI